MKINLGTLTISSSAFGHGERIPDAYGANGAGTSPPLAWSGVPEGTRSFALVAHDADAPLITGFTHWVLYGIPGEVNEISEGGGADFIQGSNGMGERGWAPVAPPPGHGTHFYYFHLYAMRTDGSELPVGLSAAELLDRIDPDVLAQARLVGTYSNG